MVYIYLTEFSSLLLDTHFDDEFEVQSAPKEERKGKDCLAKQYL